MDNSQTYQSFTSTKSISLSKVFLALVVTLLGVRLISLGLYPLFDTTEARYGEIARIMFETQNWVTPQIDYNVPFWGKPPLHTWMSAASFNFFGVSEFTARLPHFLAGVLVILLVHRFTAAIAGRKKALIAAAVLTSCLGFIIAMGMVMTDTALLLALTLTMTSFWHCFSQRSERFHGRLFFVGLAIGMLAKGPVALVIAGIALVTWALYTRQLKQAICCLPWPSGLAIFFAITLPWYIWAEIRTPGFLNYFIIGEHFYRFIESGWTGDLYGSAHDQPKGMIWLFWLAAAFPWSFYLLYLTIKTKKFSTVTEPNSAPLVSYLVAWIIAPMLLFTMAGNILAIYVMPGFAALAVLIAIATGSRKTTLVISLASAALIISALVAVVGGVLSKSSESELLGRDRSFDQNARIYYWQHRPFSAQFYSKGQAQLIDQEPQLVALLEEGKPFYLVVRHGEYAKFNQQILEHCEGIATSRKRVQLKCH